MDKGTRRIYRDSKFYQRIFFRSAEYEIESVSGQVITTKTPHCIGNGNRVVLWFKGCEGGVFKTIATVSPGSTTQFTVSDSIPECFDTAYVFCPVSLTGTLAAKVYSYPVKQQALSGKLTCEDGSDVAIISDSVAFDFTEGMTLTALPAFNAIAIEDWHSVPDGDSCSYGGTSFIHTLVLASGAGIAKTNTPFFSINGEDRRDEAQDVLSYTQNTFSGDLAYGEIEFEIPLADINALSRGDHLLQVTLSDSLLYFEQLTFSGQGKPKDPLDLDENTHTIELLGGNSISPGNITASLTRVAAPVTIPASGSNPIQIDPNDAFVNGQSEFVIINQIPGELSRSGGNYTFTRSASGTATAIATGTLISVISTGNPLILGNATITEANNELTSDSPIFDPESQKLELSPNPHNITRLWADSTENIALAIDSKKRLIGVTPRAGICQVSNGDFYLSKSDSNGVWRIYRRSGNTETAITDGTKHCHSPALTADGVDVLYCIDDGLFQNYAQYNVVSGTNVPLGLQVAPNVLGIQMIGQSLGVGTATGDRVSTFQPYTNKMLGASIRENTNLTALNPLVEGDQAGNLESPLSSWANQASFLFIKGGLSQQMIGMNSAYPGANLAQISKGGSYQGWNSFARTIAAVTAANGLEVNYQFSSLGLVHGESDEALGTTTYRSGVETLYTDYNTDIKAITGQTEDILLFLCQMSSHTYYNKTEGVIAPQQLELAENNTNIYLVCPKYFMEYEDGLHLTTQWSRILGTYYARAMQSVVGGTPWVPLSPSSAVLSGSSIVIDFNVPVTPIVFDTDKVVDPGNFGFNYSDSTNSATIASVTITGPSQVTITLSNAPSGANRQIKYAMVGTSGADSGPVTGARGCLRDSDDTQTYLNTDAYNWCVHFVRDL